MLLNTNPHSSPPLLPLLITVSPSFAKQYYNNSNRETTRLNVLHIPDLPQPY